MRVKPRVLQVINDTNIGGAGRYLLYLLRQEAMQEFDIEVACPEGLLLDQLKANGIRTLKMSDGDRSLSVSNFKQILGFLKREFHIIHAHSSLSARLAGRLCGAIIIVTRHGIGMTHGPLGMLGARMAGLVLADHHIAVSEAVARSLRAQGVPRSRVKVIYNGIDMPPENPRTTGNPLRHSLGGDPLIGMVSRMAQEKDYDTFLRAAALLKRTFPKVRYLAVGDGPERKRLEALAMDLGLSGTVVFTGYTQDIWSVLDALGILVLSSRQEGLGLAVLEAMACGLPVVASNTGGLPEAVIHGRTGLLFTPGSAENLAESLAILLKDEGKAKAMGAAGRERVLEFFSARRMAEDTVSLYWEHLRGWKA